MISQLCPTSTKTCWADLRGMSAENMDMENLEPSAILAANLRRMIDADTPFGAKPSIRAWALGKGLDVRMIDRMTKGEHAITLDTLDKVAKACGLQPWHLLLPDLAPGAVPDMPITEDERKMLGRLRKLLDN